MGATLVRPGDGTTVFTFNRTMTTAWCCPTGVTRSNCTNSPFNMNGTTSFNVAWNPNVNYPLDFHGFDGRYGISVSLMPTPLYCGTASPPPPPPSAASAPAGLFLPCGARRSGSRGGPESQRRASTAAGTRSASAAAAPTLPVAAEFPVALGATVLSSPAGINRQSFAGRQSAVDRSKLRLRPYRAR